VLLSIIIIGRVMDEFMVFIFITILIFINRLNMENNKLYVNSLLPNYCLPAGLYGHDVCVLHSRLVQLILN